MESLELIQRLALALAIGAVVGAERHWRERDEPSGGRTAGLRTFTLIGMLGGVAGLIASSLEGVAAGIVIAVLFGAMTGTVAMFQYRESVADGTFSVTSTVAAMVTYSLGVLAVLGDPWLALAGGVALTAVLASRDVLHEFMRRVSWGELRSAIILLSMTFLVLPFLPDKPVGPFGGVSPAQTWLLVIILAAISFCGYIAVKLLGDTRGELVGGAVAGLISSTAATLANARRAKAGGRAAVLAAGAASACAISYLRTAALVWTLAPDLARLSVPALLAACAAMMSVAFLLAGADRGSHEPQYPRNPFEVGPVVRMALLLVAVAFAARAAAAYFGQSGLVAVAALSGLADVDATVVTVAGLTPAIPASAALAAVAAAVVSNTFAKAGYAVVFGGPRYSLPFLLATAFALASGGGAYWLTTRI